MKHLQHILIPLIILSCIILSCRKDEIVTDPSEVIAFSSDMILFDTVFTTVGSTTKYLKVFNPHNKTIKISSIQLAGGGNSNFTININGMATNSATNVEIGAKDSMYIFVKVTVDPTNQDIAMLLTDSIVFETNGTIQDVDLVAYGQDAHFIVANTFRAGLPPYKIVAGEGENITWTDDKPYVIYGYAIVDSTGSLTIEEGVDIHFHPGSGLWVYKGGSIKVNGTIDSVVTFQGDRLESYYQDVPGQWDRIWLNEGSVDNEFNYAVIKNGFIGIQAEITSSDMGNKLVLNNTIIENMAAWGLYTKTYVITATNTVVANCAEMAVYLSAGGYYDFQHCTFANYWSHATRQLPLLVVADYYKNNSSGTIYTGDLLNATFGNCIIYGNNEEEILLDNKYSSTFNYKFDHCLIKSTNDITNATYYENCIKNSDPLFINYSSNIYQLISSSSPAVDKGKASIGASVSIDLKGNNRTIDTAPDLGAYELE